jgi:hypothetical protein
MARTKKFFVAIAALLVMTWFYFTPHLAVRSMRIAAEEKNSEKLSDFVNFPALRENIRGVFSAKLATANAKEKSENAVGALGAAFASALMGPMIDAIVTPENVAMMMRGDKPSLERKPAGAETAKSEVEVSMAYEAFDRFLVTAKKKQSADEPLGLVFRRDGLFSWKLSAVRLP